MSELTEITSGFWIDFDKFSEPHNEIVIPPLQCKAIRKVTLLEKCFTRKIHHKYITQCQRYQGHEKFGYEHEDCFGKEW